MNLYTLQNTNPISVSAVDVTRADNTITFAVTTTNTADKNPRVDTFTLDYNLLSARSDFDDSTQWIIGYNPEYAPQGGGPLFIIYNTFKETFPTKGKSGTFTARRDGVNIIFSLYVPFKNSSLDECSLLVVSEDITKITADSSFSAPIVVTDRLSIRPLVMPSVRAVSVTPIGQDLDVVLQLCKNGQDISNIATLYISCDTGSLSSSVIKTNGNGQATLRIYGDPHRAGEAGVLNVGFKYWSGELYVNYIAP